MDIFYIFFGTGRRQVPHDRIFVRDDAYQRNRSPCIIGTLSITDAVPIISEQKSFSFTQFFVLFHNEAPLFPQFAYYEVKPVSYSSVYVTRS